MKIFKYILHKNNQQILIPKTAKFLSVQNLLGKIAMWFLVNPDEKKVKQTFRYFETEQMIEQFECIEYLGTCQLWDGEHIIHIFVET